VFIPILLMGGIVGRLFREFAVTLSAAIALSLVISLTTTPMMCAKFLMTEQDRKHGRLYHWSERGYQRVVRGYEHALDFVLEHTLPVLLVTLATIGFTIYLYVIIPKGFFPQQDTGRLSGNVQAAQDVSFPALIEKLHQFMVIVQKDPAVDTLVSFTGGGRGGGNSASMFITLKDLGERKASAQQIIARIRPKTAHIPGAQLFLSAVQDVRIGGRQSNADYQYTLQGDNIAELMTWSRKLEKTMHSLKMLRDISSDQQNQGLQSTVIIDRSTAARLGVSLAAIDNTLYDCFGQRQVSVMYSGINQYHVVMEVDPKYANSPAVLSSVYVHSSSGREVPLSAFAHFGIDQTPLSIPHQGQFPAVTISFNLDPGTSLSGATTAIEDLERKMGMPASIHAGFQGTAQAFQESLHNEPLLILAALIAVYIVLGILYESLVHPITILSTLPSAGVGALIALLLTNTEFTIIALIGIILLIGIVKKNAIMMIDFALEAERKDGKSPRDAIREACLLRFRPITMTTMAAMFGGLPLALGLGVGSELRRPLGIAIVGGLIVSQMLTLFTTPVTYLYIDRLRWRARKRRQVGGESVPATH